MTRQTLDSVVYERHVYDLAAASKPLPIRLPYVPDRSEFFHTGCWRGFRCVYGVSENRLCLIEFWNYTGMEINMTPLIHDRKPKVDMSRWSKSGALDLKLAYTGHLLAGEKLAPGWRDYGLFPHPFGYVKAIEFVFKRGKLIDVLDCSDALEEIRLYLRSRRPRPRDRARYLDWLEMRNKLDMWAWFLGEKRSEGIR